MVNFQRNSPDVAASAATKMAKIRRFSADVVREHDEEGKIPGGILSKLVSFRREAFLYVILARASSCNSKAP